MVKFFLLLFVVSGSRGLLGGSIFCLSWALAALMLYLYLSHGPIVGSRATTTSKPEDLSGVLERHVLSVKYL